MSVVPQAATYEIPKKEKRPRRWRSKNNGKDTKATLQVHALLLIFFLCCLCFDIVQSLNGGKECLTFVCIWLPGSKLYLLPAPVPVLSPSCLQSKSLHRWVKHPRSLSWIPRITCRCFTSAKGLLPTGQQQWVLSWFTVDLKICFFLCVHCHTIKLFPWQLSICCVPAYFPVSDICLSPVHVKLKSAFSSLVTERDRLRHTIDLQPTQPAHVVGLKTAYASVSDTGSNSMVLWNYTTNTHNTWQEVWFYSPGVFLSNSGFCRCPTLGAPGLQREQRIRVLNGVLWRSGVPPVLFFFWERGQTSSARSTASPCSQRNKWSADSFQRRSHTKSLACPKC